MPTQTPTLAEVIDRVIHNRLRETFGGWMPARVETYNAATNRASLQILLLDDYEDEEGERQTEPFPVVDDIPVAWLSLGGKFVVRSTVSKGDEGIYLTAARPTSKWMQTGGMVDPENDAHHELDGGIFLPYRISTGGQNQDPFIEITSSEIRAGGSSKLALESELNTLRSAFNAHTHATAGTGTPSPPAAVPGVIPVSSFPGTQKLKGG